MDKFSKKLSEEENMVITGVSKPWTEHSNLGKKEQILSTVVLCPLDIGCRLWHKRKIIQTLLPPSQLLKILYICLQLQKQEDLLE